MSDKVAHAGMGRKPPDRIPSKISKTIDILGPDRKPPTKYELKDQEKAYHELAVKSFDKTERKCRKLAVDCTEKGVAPFGDRGFLSTVVFSYNNHYILQTTPEDWWFTVINKIAITVKEMTDSSSEGIESEDCKKLREFFVSHQGKETLIVTVPPIPLEEQDFAEVFQLFGQLIQKNIKVPEFVEIIRADFSTSTPTHIIESEITVMSSLQNFFEYRCRTRCGIPQIEMMGSESDWRKLKEKLVDLRKILAPLETFFIEFHNWFEKLEIIFQKLIDTYTGSPDIKWWCHIFDKKEAWGSGKPPRYLNGWFISDFLNCKNATGFEDLPSGLNTTPLILDGEGYPTPVHTTLVAGIAGIQVEESVDVPKVRALHGWAMFYNDTSVEEDVEDRYEGKTTREEKSFELEYTKKWRETGNGYSEFALFFEEYDPPSEEESYGLGSQSQSGTGIVRRSFLDKIKKMFKIL